MDRIFSLDGYSMHQMGKKIFHTTLIFIIFISGSILICHYFGTKMPFGSVDVALHYLVVDDYFNWENIIDDTMDRYPPLAHAFTALLSKLIGLTPFMGMYYVSLSFVFTIYFILYYSLQRNSIILSIISSFVFIIVIYTLRYSWSIYGFEIIGNFFFAQAAGGAAFLVALWIITGCYLCYRAILLSAAISLFLGYIYPLAQVDWCLGVMVFFGSEIYLRTVSGKNANFKYVFTIILVLSMTVLFNPEFYYMVKISKNPGGMNPAIGSLGVLRLFNLCLFLSGLIIYMIYINSRRRALLFMAAASLATAMASGIQDLTYEFGLGSEYAVRKHTFAIITLLIAGTVTILVEWVDYYFARYFLFEFKYIMRSVVASAFATTTVILLISVYAFERKDFISVQNEIRAMPSLGGRTIALDRDIQQEFNYILSLVDFRLNRALAVEQNLGIKTGYSTENLAFALVSKNAPIDHRCDVPGFYLEKARLIQFNCKVAIP